MKLTKVHLAKLSTGHEVVLLPYVTTYEGKEDKLFIGHYLDGEQFVCLVFTPDGECLGQEVEITELFDKHELA